MPITQRNDHEQMKILVVDDEVANLQKLYRTLVGRYPVLAAQTAGEALRFLEQDPAIAVIVTDQRMPDMTGVRSSAAQPRHAPSRNPRPPDRVH